MTLVGSNHPPAYLALVPETTDHLRRFIAEHPVFQSEEEARAGASMMKRGKASLADLEDERDGLVRPLNAQVRETNDQYREVRRPLETAVETLEHRASLWMRREQDRRWREAEAIRRAAEEANARLDATMAQIEDCRESAALGEVGIDIVEQMQRASVQTAEAHRLERDAARAERDAPVRLGVGYGNAVTLKDKETLVIANWHEAITNIGCTERIREAIITEARAYRKKTGNLPGGIVASFTREI